MTDKKKAGKKVWFITLSSVVVFCFVVIFATCKLFDNELKDVNSVNWQSLVKNSTWTFNKMSISNKALLVPALQNVKSISFSDDCSVTVFYSNDNGVGSFSFNGGKAVFYSNCEASFTLRQPGNEGYISNNCTVTFSDQSKQQFDNSSYVMTLDVQDAGSLYFFY